MYIQLIECKSAALYIYTQYIIIIEEIAVKLFWGLLF